MTAGERSINILMLNYVRFYIDFTSRNGGHGVASNRETRSRQILKMLDLNEFVSVADLIRELEVSHMTVRRDLGELEDRGLLVRRYGGAMRSSATASLFSFDRRANTNRREKEAVCRAAARYIKDGDTIFVDCGTTLFRLAHIIATHRAIRVITNSLPVVSELLEYPEISLSFVGGEIDRDRKASYGPKAEQAIREYHADRAFIGADGVSLANGLSSYDEKEGNITRRMGENADEVVLLCDSSKLETDSFSRFAPLSLVTHLVTDGGIESEIRKHYARHGIDVAVGD